MSSDVALGAAMTNNLLALQKTNMLLEMTQNRLATGRKVNSALDNPQSFFTAQSLTNRSSDLGRLLDGMGQSISSIKEADKGVTSLTSLLDQAQATVSDAQDTLAGGVGVAMNGNVNIKGVADLTTLGIADNQTFTITVGSTTTAAIQVDTGDSGQTLVNEINTAFTTAGAEATASLDDAGRLKIEAKDAGDAIRFGGGNFGVADYTALGLGSFVKSQADGDGATPIIGGTVVAGSTLKSTALVGVKGSDTVDNTFAAIETGQSITFDISINGGTAISVNVDETMTIDELVSAINSDANNNGQVAASFNEGSGQISLSMNTSVKTANLSINPLGGAGTTTGFGFGGGLSDVQTTDTVASEELITFTKSDTLDKLQTLEDNYNELRSQIDALVKDANYRGVNLLGGDTLTTYFNEDRSNKLVTVGQNLTSDGLGLAAADFGSMASATDAADNVRSALSSARDFGSALANSLAVLQTREDFTKETSQVLNEGADKLTLADPNEEGANMLALQTRLQLGVTSLSLAAQSQQSVLKLF
jgi:flagellin